MKANLILIGAPGSGKGTQSETLKKKGYHHISTGDLLREEVKSGSELGQKIAQIIDQGNFVSDEMAMDLINKNCDLSKASYIFDGMPRTLNQAKLLLQEVIKDKKYKVVYFKIEDSKLTERLVNRRTCSHCGKIHNVKGMEESKLVCSCGSKEFIHRKDDSLEAVPTRIKTFHEKTKPLLDFFKEKNVLVEIDADQDPDQVLASLEEVI